MKIILALAALVLTGASAPLPAQQRPPGCTAPEHRQFDYWLGEWTVTDSAGTRTMGSNRITSEEAGCLVHEHWTGAGGGTGQSFNFYHRVRQQWEQVWVASTPGGMLHLTGKLEGSSMVLQGETTNPAGKTTINRVSWIPQPDGRVRQKWETSTDGGSSWSISFDGWYRKR